MCYILHFRIVLTHSAVSLIRDGGMLLLKLLFAVYEEVLRNKISVGNVTDSSNYK